MLPYLRGCSYNRTAQAFVSAWYVWQHCGHEWGQTCADRSSPLPDAGSRRPVPAELRKSQSPDQRRAYDAESRKDKRCNVHCSFLLCCPAAVRDVRAREYEHHQQSVCNLVGATL
eukprot:1000558-Rhodomonas_salina.2